MALQQQKMEEKVVKSAKKVTDARELKATDTLIIDSESTSSSEYSESETSDTESDSSSEGECKKRQKLFKTINHPKR